MGTVHHDESPLFLMRLWGEDGVGSTNADGTDTAGTEGAIRSRWRGKLLHVTTGETRYFSDWPALLSILQSLFPEATDAENQPTSAIPRQD